MSKKNEVYLGAIATKDTPQREPIPGRADQVQNSEGGFVWGISEWERMNRFLILGSDAPTYYASAKKITIESTKAVAECLKSDPTRAVRLIVQVSEGRRAPRNDPALVALAMAASEVYNRSTVARNYALENLSKVARTGTHLFQFLNYAQGVRGWGRGLREAVAGWYTDRGADSVAYQAVKYRQREGWTHRDVLRKAHPVPPTPEHNDLFKWITQEEVGEVVPDIIHGFEMAKKVNTSAEVAQLISRYGLTREMIPTEFLKYPEVWEALLEKMPMMAMVRNLANMTRCGLLAPMSAATNTVVSRLDSEAIKKAGVHPMQVLVALKTYQSGHGAARAQAVGFHSHSYVSPSSVNTWNPVGKIVDALDAAFYISFGNVEPSGKRTMLAVDVSPSMDVEISGMIGVSARMAAGAMAMVTAKAEPNYMVTAFKSAGAGYGRRYNTGIAELSVTPRQRLDDIMKEFNPRGWGGTDCSLPVLYAMEKNLDIDTFVVYTDSETFAGRPHVSQALKQYREKSGKNRAKLIVVAMVCNGFSIADPRDPGMLDVVGFDTATPNIITEFAK